MTLTNNLTDDRCENWFRARACGPLGLGKEQFQHAAGAIDDGCERRVHNIAVLGIVNQDVRERLCCRRIVTLTERQSKLKLNDRIGIAGERNSFFTHRGRSIEHWLRKSQAMSPNLRMRVAESMKNVGFIKCIQTF